MKINNLPVAAQSPSIQAGQKGCGINVQLANGDVVDMAQLKKPLFPKPAVWPPAPKKNFVARVKERLAAGMPKLPSQKI